MVKSSKGHHEEFEDDDEVPHGGLSLSPVAFFVFACLCVLGFVFCICVYIYVCVYD